MENQMSRGQFLFIHRIEQNRAEKQYVVHVRRYEIIANKFHYNVEREEEEEEERLLRLPSRRVAAAEMKMINGSIGSDYWTSPKVCVVLLLLLLLFDH